ncbi:cyclase family protein [Candidatus Gottesmanbacteria bacterium]|nr:cyclase family protein [Candidatus Gottesmanbacteria bacterium]
MKKKNFQYVDLSLPLTNQTPVFPGDPVVRIESVANVEADGCSVHQYNFSGHTGTHIDAQSHFLAGGKNISEYPPEKFVGRGLVVDARGRNVIDIDILENINILKDTIVLFWTDWVKNIDQQIYFTDHPVIGKTLAQRLINVGVKMMGIDTPSPDHEPYTVHKILLGGDVLILENLCNLDLVYRKRFRVYAIPIKVETDGVPVRVVVEVEL